MANLVRAMLADAVFNDRDAKDPIELSRLAGLSLARVSSALAAGESRGLFQRHRAPTPVGPGPRTPSGTSHRTSRTSPASSRTLRRSLPDSAATWPSSLRS